MSRRERERSHVVRLVIAKELSQGEAGERLGLCVRQVKRLVHAYRERGDAGLVSKQRGRVSPRRLGEAQHVKIVELLRSKYEGFGPTLAAEKLFELHGVEISREDAHRELALDPAALEDALARREERVLTMALTFSCGGTKYAVRTKGPGLALRGAKIELLQLLDGSMRARFKDRELAFLPLYARASPASRLCALSRRRRRRSSASSRSRERAFPARGRSLCMARAQQRRLQNEIPGPQDSPASISQSKFTYTAANGLRRKMRDG